MCPAKIQISQLIHAVGLESSLSAFLIAKGAKSLYADNENSDLTAHWAHMSEGTLSLVVADTNCGLVMLWS